jgi:hypothetical protein
MLWPERIGMMHTCPLVGITHVISAVLAQPKYNRQQPQRHNRSLVLAVPVCFDQLKVKSDGNLLGCWWEPNNENNSQNFISSLPDCPSRVR